jgi:hypothetical protein
MAWIWGPNRGSKWGHFGVHLGSRSGGVQNGVDFGVILRVQNSLKTAQFVVFSMYLHMYNMYLYGPYDVHICIICINMCKHS